MEGFGRMTWNDGKVYEGQFGKDKIEGFGFFYWPDGKKVQGWWHEGK